MPEGVGAFSWPSEYISLLLIESIDLNPAFLRASGCVWILESFEEFS